MYRRRWLRGLRTRRRGCRLQIFLLVFSPRDKKLRLYEPIAVGVRVSSRDPIFFLDEAENGILVDVSSLLSPSPLSTVFLEIYRPSVRRSLWRTLVSNLPFFMLLWLEENKYHNHQYHIMLTCITRFKT